MNNDSSNSGLMRINFSSLISAQREKDIIAVLDTNEYTQNHGIVITQEIAEAIIEAKKQALVNQGMVELTNRTLTRFVKAFSESFYITQDIFSETVGELTELFYHIKNEIGNALSDDDLISEMLLVFDETCFGSIELMQSKGLEKILRKYKMNDSGIWDDYEFKKPSEIAYVDYIFREDDTEYEEKWRE